MKTVKRVYERAQVAAAPEGYAVALDGRAVKTPGRRPLVLPTAALAEAVAAEWQAQEDEVRPDKMPLTRLAATAIDRAAEQRAQVVGEVVAYAATDLVCHRAGAPPELAARQAEGWQPLVDWLDERYGARLAVTGGVIALDQPAEALAALRGVVETFDDFALAALYAVTSASGSLVIALALAEDRIDAEEAWALSEIDESFQIERWGDDREAAERRARLRDEVRAAARFLDLSRG